MALIGVNELRWYHYFDCETVLATGTGPGQQRLEGGLIRRVQVTKIGNVI